MHDDIIEFITNLLLRKGPLPNNQEIEGYRYLDAGHVDSIGLIKFVAQLESRFDVRIDSEDFLREEMRTVGGLAMLIENKLRTQD